MWWGMVPAQIKGFIDRTFLPGFAFRYHEKDPFWDRLLAGRSARMIVTSDAPALYNRLAYGNAPYEVVRKLFLRFCGFKPVHLTPVGGVKGMSPAQRERVLKRVRRLGATGR
jgi:putative NADPH-quinone reductase